MRGESHVWSYGKRVESENKPAEKATMYGKRVDKHEPAHPPLVPGVETSKFYGDKYTTPSGLEKLKAFFRKNRMWPESPKKLGVYGTELDKPTGNVALFFADRKPASADVNGQAPAAEMKTTEAEKLQKQARQEQTLAGKNEDRIDSEAEEA